MQVTGRYVARVRWWTPVLALMVAWLAALAGCAVLDPDDVPAPRAMLPHERTYDALKRRIAAADVVVSGAVTGVRRELDYEQFCGIVARLQGCRSASAWRVEIRGPQTWYAFAFVPQGEWLPVGAGTEAVFLLKRTWLVPVGKCAKMAYYANACYTTQGASELWLADTLDIVPRRDSAVVDSLWHVVRRSR
jgi:hypothetical protein